MVNRQGHVGPVNILDCVIKKVPINYLGCTLTVWVVLYTKTNTSLTDFIGIGDNSDLQNGVGG